MLLKVSDGDGGWVLLDNVEQVHLVSRTHNVINQSDLHDLEDADTVVLVSKDCFSQGKPVKVGVIEFVRDGNPRRILFTGLTFVCDDKGDTIDRLSVQDKTSKRR